MITTGTTFKTSRPDPAYRRDIRGVVLHHTGGSSAVSCHANGSWHFLIDRNGDIYHPIDIWDVAWHVAKADRMRPEWVTRTAQPWAQVSDVNTCTVGIELVSPAGASLFTDAQYESLESVVQYIEGSVNKPLWYVGHGHLQLDRRTTEPDNFDWERAGFGEFQTGMGYQRGEEHMTEKEKAILAAVRETNYQEYAEELIRMMAGLNATASSVKDWVEKIGALEAQLANNG